LVVPSRAKLVEHGGLPFAAIVEVVFGAWSVEIAVVGTLEYRDDGMSSPTARLGRGSSFMHIWADVEL
jgi:hypothetical protein